MKQAPNTLTVLLLVLFIFLAFTTISYAFSPGDGSGTAALTDGPDIPAPGFTLTPTRPPDEPGDRPRGGGGPPSIPEPTTIVLTGLGLAGMAGYVMRRRRSDGDGSDQ
jgi:hypothetical protein